MLSLLTGIGLFYAGFCVFFYFAQDYFFFRPERLPVHFKYRYPFPFEETHFEMEDGGQINGIHFRIPNSKGVIFYMKGNSKSIKGWGKFARDFVGKGYDFFMFDYRGFGKSRGRRTEATIYNDLQHIYQWLHRQYPEEQIVLYGRSLGSGFATRMASWNKPKMLILDCPYFSFHYNIRRFVFFLPLKWLLRYQIRTDLFIKKVQCPVIILHGKKDRLIPFRQGAMLQAIRPDICRLIPIEKAGHNNMTNFPEYHDTLYDILNSSEVQESQSPKVQK